MKRILGLIIVLLCSTGAYSQSLATADSLFNEGKYTESFEIYKTLLEEEKVVSPSMLLKMAYIKEGLGGTSDALYYLNLYYLKTADKKVLFKMEELAQKAGADGYEYNDFEFIQTVFFKYFNTIVLTLISIGILLLAISFYLKFRKGVSPAVPSIFMVFVLALTFVLINFGKQYNRAVVTKSNAYLMSGPSSAAEVLTIIKKGNRVETKGTTDIWTKIESNSKVGYIKTEKLKEVEL
ncbi:SH3 domain-containing protein [Fulvivirga lutea]|uniref:SH3 domain-containing protein n=1 Tax=Fulvivirga lutea TaxID=2810512 RepID=A0A974WF57_9BACT|nr:SH3 domain-containing protein [Fulvivirga lutea]QSE97318.1 SH3 domain-containing protein [Fulvivirga lutea]